MEKFDVLFDENFDASPDEVFTALTDRDKIEIWSGSEGHVEHRVGGYYQLFDGEVSGEVKEFDPGYTLCYTWKNIQNNKNNNNNSSIRFNFAKASYGTKLIVEHSALDNPDEFEKRKQELELRVFNPLRKFFQDE